jgi:hypothetical protein
MHRTAPPSTHIYARRGRPPAEPWWGRSRRSGRRYQTYLWERHDTSARQRYSRIPAHASNCCCQFTSEQAHFWQSRQIWLDPIAAEFNRAIRGRRREAAAPPTFRGRRSRSSRAWNSRGQGGRAPGARHQRLSSAERPALANRGTMVLPNLAVRKLALDVLGVATMIGIFHAAGLRCRRLG